MDVGIQRGNNRQDVFFVDDDRRAYLDFLAAEAERHRLAILAFCLMTNHVHLVVLPEGERALAAAVGRTHWLYAQYVNRLHHRSGRCEQDVSGYEAPAPEKCLCCARRGCSRTAKFPLDRLQPLWNKVIDGFENHEHGIGSHR